MSKKSGLYWKLSFYFFFFFFTWSASYSLFSIWLGQEIHLTGAQTGMVFSINSVFALLMQPLYGYISDKIGLRKHVLIFISVLLIFVGPFFIFVYAPLLAWNVMAGAVVGGVYLGTAFLAGVGAIETYVERVGRKHHFEYGKSRMWGSLGWAAATFFAGRLYTINPSINFWIATASAVILFLIIMSTKVEVTEGELQQSDSVTLKDVGQLLKLKDFWLFMLFIMGGTCIYGVFDQQFPLYFSSMFSSPEAGNQMYGYLNSFQVFLEAGMMFVAPSIVNRLGARNSLIIAGLLMFVRIAGSGLAVGPIQVSFMKLLNAVELPLLLIAVFKYLAQNFDLRLSSILYLVGYQFSTQVGQIVLSPVVGELYDNIGFRQTYFVLGIIVLIATIFAAIVLKRDNQSRMSLSASAK